MPHQDPSKDLADEARRTAEELGRDAAEAVDAARHRGAEFLDNAHEKGAEFIGHARHRGARYADHARDEARRLYHEGERHAAEAAGYAEDYYDELATMVRRNPGPALGIAVCVGFVLGLVVARR